MKNKKMRAAAANSAALANTIPLTLGLIANKWSVALLSSLRDAEKQTLRFSELKKAQSGISQRELTRHLREFEKSGLVVRRVFPQVPPRVEYTLTPLGVSLFTPIEALSQWAILYGKQVQQKRTAFAKSQARGRK